MRRIPCREVNRVTAVDNLWQKLQAGRQLLVEQLADEELSAMHELILEGKAEIVGLACRPYLSARQDRIIISH